MSDSERKPLALVVDDIPEFQERIPRGLEKLGVRAETAANIAEAFSVAAEHHSSSDDLFDLVILDMHMPQDAHSTEVQEDGGIKVLEGLLFLRFQSRHCPVIIYTAYPSYDNCVKAIKAGAYAYIPKSKVMTAEQEGTEGGFGELMEMCKRLMVEGPSESRLPPTDEWLENNFEWLCENYSDRWIAFVEQAVAKEAGCSGEAREGLLILDDDSREAVSRQVMTYPGVLSSQPPIVFLPGPSENTTLDSEES